MKRRQLLERAAILATAAAASSLRPAGAQPARRVPTPAQTEGPFYPVEPPREVDADLMAIGGAPYRRGEPLLLRGTVQDLDGQPVAGAVVEIWQCDADGHYHHPGDGGRADAGFQGYGRVAVDEAGRYVFRAMRPVPYPGRTPHSHVKVLRGARTLLTTQMYVAGEPLNARDGLLRSMRDPAQRDALVVPLAREAASGGWAAQFPIVLDLRA